MTQREIYQLVEGYIGTHSGYLNGFSYSIHDGFYLRYCDLDIDVASYRARGLTTRNAFIEILKGARARDQARIIRGVFEMMPPHEARAEEVQKKVALYNQLIRVAERLEDDGEIETPDISDVDEVVSEALRDAEALLETRGPTSAVDRAHTALHGYMRRICSNRKLVIPPDPSLTTLFKIMREQLSEFSATVPHDVEAKRVFGGMAAVLDSLNTIRNRGTLAHPNELLLDAPEAMLYINLSRTVLSYLEAKIQKA